SPRSLLHQGTLLGNPEEATLELELNDCTIALCTLSTGHIYIGKRGKVKDITSKKQPQLLPVGIPVNISGIPVARRRC
ncbi:hypothetical protein JTE90_017337, partial [Oedothorax gibbosus]